MGALDRLEEEFSGLMAGNAAREWHQNRSWASRWQRPAQKPFSGHNQMPLSWQGEKNAEVYRDSQLDSDSWGDRDVRGMDGKRSEKEVRHQSVPTSWWGRPELLWNISHCGTKWCCKTGRAKASWLTSADICALSLALTYGFCTSQRCDQCSRFTLWVYF